MKVNFLETNCNNGAENMAIDEKMLSDAIAGGLEGPKYAKVRFYEWSPKCISLGRNQKESFDGDINVVRRVTGGRALLHDNELTYCVVAPIGANESVIQSYKRVSDCLIAGFRRLKIAAEYGHERGVAKGYCMTLSTGADVVWMGKKLVGSAQYRVKGCAQERAGGGWFLQHGSILFDADFELIEKIFGEKVDRNKIATLNEINPSLDKGELIEALKYGFEHGFNL